MSWTDERVSLLKKLWGEGKTAAEIASTLGGVTRNAVIGKAHRLKLSNRVSPIQQNNKKPANSSIPPSEKKTIAPVAKQEKPVEAKAKGKASEDITEGENSYSLMDLGPRQCRWPSGDPRHDDFGFCGAEAVPGLPYCAEHAKLAYQTTSRARTLVAEDFEDKGNNANQEEQDGNIKVA